MRSTLTGGQLLWPTMKLHQTISNGATLVALLRTSVTALAEACSFGDGLLHDFCQLGQQSCGLRQLVSDLHRPFTRQHSQQGGQRTVWKNIHSRAGQCLNVNAPMCMHTGQSLPTLPCYMYVCIKFWQSLPFSVHLVHRSAAACFRRAAPQVPTQHTSPAFGVTMLRPRKYNLTPNN